MNARTDRNGDPMVEEKPITYTLTLKLCQFRNLSYERVSLN